MFGRDRDFRESSTNLRARIDAVISSVKRCADVVERINQLSDQRNRALNAQRSLSQTRPPQVSEPQEKHIEWIQSVRQLTQQIGASEKERRSLFGNLLDIPESLAVGSHELQDICSKLEKQRLLQIERLTERTSG